MNADQTVSDNSEIVIRKLPNQDLDKWSEIASFSPDGRYATYIDWHDPEIGVIDLKTGKKWEITKDGDYNNYKNAFSTRFNVVT